MTRALFHACGINLFLLPFAIVDGVDRGLPRWWIGYMILAWSVCAVAVIIENNREQ